MKLTRNKFTYSLHNYLNNCKQTKQNETTPNDVITIVNLTILPAPSSALSSNKGSVSNHEVTSYLFPFYLKTAQPTPYNSNGTTLHGPYVGFFTVYYSTEESEL